MRGPHDDEIEGGDPVKDHARERLDDFLKRRDPGVTPEEPECDSAGEPLRPADPTPDPKL